MFATHYTNGFCMRIMLNFHSNGKKNYDTYITSLCYLIHQGCNKKLLAAYGVLKNVKIYRCFTISLNKCFNNLNRIVEAEAPLHPMTV